MRMEAHISKVWKAAWHQLHQIGTIRPYLSIDETKKMLHMPILTANWNRITALSLVVTGVVTCCFHHINCIKWTIVIYLFLPRFIYCQCFT